MATYEATGQDKPSKRFSPARGLRLREAFRRLVEIGLTVKVRPSQPSRARAERANEMAAKTIDGLIDAGASTEEVTNRKRRLLKGPEEFREVRVDCANKT